MSEQDPIPKPQLDNFERAFSSGGGGCVRTCECGRVFYNPDNSWSWDDGELEKLAESKATALEYTVGTIILEGKEYVMDCDCWHTRAKKIIAWLEYNQTAVADFLSLEKKRKVAEAAALATVEGHEEP